MPETSRHTRPIIISTLSVVAITALAVLGWAYFPGAEDQDRATPTTITVTVTPAPEICDPALLRSQGHDFVDGLLFCDAGWARGGATRSDHLGIFHWVDGTWVQIPRAGSSPATGYPCYDRAALRHEGAPEELLRTVLDCAD